MSLMPVSANHLCMETQKQRPRPPRLLIGQSIKRMNLQRLRPLFEFLK